MTRYASAFRRVARSLHNVELTRDSMEATHVLSPMELVGNERGSSRWLDFYGDEGIRLGLERYGILEAMRRRGFDDFVFHIEPDESRHTLLVEARHIGGGRPVRLVELVVRRDILRCPDVSGLAEEAPSFSPMQVLTIDWLALQNPRVSFSVRRPRLPGQAAPGLGIGEQVMELLHRVVARLKLQALVTVAEYFHNAALYVTELPYLDPTCMGEFLALRRLLLEEQGLSLAQASWAVEWGFVTRQGEPFVWRGELQVGARGTELESWLKSRTWEQLAGATSLDVQYDLERVGFMARWEDEVDALTGDCPEGLAAGREPV